MNLFDIAGDDYIVYKGVVYIIDDDEKRKIIEEFLNKYYSEE